MKCFLLQKVRYLIKGRGIVWAVLLYQREGLSLLYVKRPDAQRSDSLVVAIEGNGFYDDAPGSRFPLEKGDLLEIGGRLQALGDGINESEVRELVQPEDLF